MTHGTQRFPAGLIADSRGVTIIEFAIIAPVFLMLLVGIFDVGRTAYARSILQGAVQNAGRDAGLESGKNQLTAIDTYVQDQMRPLVGKDAQFKIERLNYRNFSDVGKPEDFDDKNGNDAFDVDEECFTDSNANGQWDEDVGADGLGGANDIVVYRATVTYDRVFPLWRMIGENQYMTLSASTVLRNQPFGPQAARPASQICPPPPS